MCRTQFFLAMIFNEIKSHVNTSLGLDPLLPPCVRTCLPCRDYTTDRNAFNVLFQKVQGLRLGVCLSFGLGFDFRV